MLRKTSQVLLTCALSAGLILSGAPTIACAVTSEELQAQLNDAQAHLGELYERAEQASEELNGTRSQINDTNARIDENVKVAEQKQAELVEAEQLLSEVVSEDYKRGNISLLSLILGSSSVESIVSNIYVANKVSTRQQEVIETVKTVRAELNEARESLEADRSKLEKLAADQERNQAALQASVEETQVYVSGLSTEVQEALAREEEERRLAAEQAAREEAERIAAQEAAEREEAQRQQAQQQTQQTAPQQQQTQQQTQQQSRPTSSQNSNNSSSSSSSSTPKQTNSSRSSGSSSYAGSVVAAALSQVGTSYVYGTSNPGVSFDCSGLVMYCYSTVGISLPHYSGAMSGYCSKPASQAVAGDIVWRPGHVGICIGNGQTVEAFSPGQGVGIGSVYDFVSAGSPA